MSVESLRRRLVVTVAASRAAEQAFDGVAGLFHAAGRAFEGLAEPFFLIQADSARQYRDLTGNDLGEDLGYPELYEGARSEEVTVEDDDED